MQIVTIANQKGGSGKTATAAALAQAAAHDGKKVLAIDLDPQGNLSFTLGAEMNRKTSLDLLEGEPARHIIQHCGGLDVIPASWNNQTIRSGAGSAKRLQKALLPLKARYDLIVIDTPPTGGELQYNALQASTGLIIPLQADIFGLQGLYQIADTAEQIKASNPALSVLGVVFTRHNPRSTIARQMQEAIENAAKEMGVPVLGAIREGVAIREAQALQTDLFDYAPKAKPAQDYKQLYETIREG